MTVICNSAVKWDKTGNFYSKISITLPINSAKITCKRQLYTSANGLNPRVMSKVK